MATEPLVESLLRSPNWSFIAVQSLHGRVVEGILADAQALGHVDDVLHAGPVREILEGRVRGDGGGLGHRQRPAVLVGLVERQVGLNLGLGGTRCPARGERHPVGDRRAFRDPDRRESVQHAGLHVHALRHGGGQDVRLEGGSDLLRVLGHVDVAEDLGAVLGLVTGPAVDGQDGAGARLDQDRSDVRVPRQRLPVLAHLGLALADGAGEAAHHRGAERRVDLQAAVVQLALAQVVGALKLLLHHVHEVAGRAVPGGGVVGVHLGEILGPRRARRNPGRGTARQARELSQRDVAVPVHVVEHVLPARGQGGVLGAGVRVGVEQAGRVDQRGQHRGLRDGELRGRLIEVGLGGGTDASGLRAERDGVQVSGDDPRLGLQVGELDRHDDLLELVAERLVRVIAAGEAAVVVLHELLGQRGSALRVGTALEVLVDGPPQPGDGDAALGVERAVLGRGDRLVHDLGNLRRLKDDVADAIAGERRHQLAVAVIHVGGLGQRCRRDGGRHCDRLVGVQERPDDHQDNNQAAGAEQAEDLLPGPAAPPVTGPEPLAEAPAAARSVRPAIPAAATPATPVPAAAGTAVLARLARAAPRARPAPAVALIAVSNRRA